MELRLRVFFESSQSEELAVLDHGDDLYELMETPLLFEASIGEIYKAVRNGDQLIIKVRKYNDVRRKICKQNISKS